jgi:hypothetical protein
LEAWKAATEIAPLRRRRIGKRKKIDVSRDDELGVYGDGEVDVVCVFRVTGELENGRNWTTFVAISAIDSRKNATRSAFKLKRAARGGRDVTRLSSSKMNSEMNSVHRPSTAASSA